MNWLDPKDVAASLEQSRSTIRRLNQSQSPELGQDIWEEELDEARKQFVRSQGKRLLHILDCKCADCESIRVARLLVGAMDGG